MIIIGAGAAGLAAAQTLTGAGKSVLLLEARDRLGGRIHTVYDPASPMPVELGAEFIHGRPKELLDIARISNLLLYNAEGEHWHFQGGRLTRANDVWDQIEQVMGRLKQLRDEDISFCEFLQRHVPAERQKELATAFVEGFDAAPADRISAKALAQAEASAEQQGGYESLRIASGYDGIIEHFRSTLDPQRATVRLRTIVSTVRWRRGAVEIESRGPCGEDREPAQAKAAVITVPLGVLKASQGQEGALTFEPEVPGKRQAAQQLEMGAVVKILLQFASPFWREPGLGTVAQDQRLDRMAFVHASKIPFATWWSFFPVESTTLVGWAGGPSAQGLIGKSEPQILRQAISTLSNLFGVDHRQVESTIQKVWTCDWQSDVFSRGAYSYVPVGAIPAAKELGKPVEKTLFFCSLRARRPMLSRLAEQWTVQLELDDARQGKSWRVCEPDVRTSSAASHWPGFRILGVVDVADADELAGRHDPQPVVSHVANDVLERVAELGERQHVRFMGFKLLHHPAAEGEQRHRPARIAYDFQPHLGQQFQQLLMLFVGKIERRRRLRRAFLEPQKTLHNRPVHSHRSIAAVILNRRFDHYIPSRRWKPTGLSCR